MSMVKKGYMRRVDIGTMSRRVWLGSDRSGWRWVGVVRRGVGWDRMSMVTMSDLTDSHGCNQLRFDVG